MKKQYKNLENHWDCKRERERELYFTKISYSFINQLLKRQE